MATGNTIVKRITVGTPLAIGVPTQGTLKSLDDVDTTLLASNVQYIKYNEPEDTFVFTNLISEVRAMISVSDGGGDGSLDYSEATGVISYIGPSAEEVRAHLVAGTGIAYDSSTGVITINSTTDDIPEGTSNLYYTRARWDSAAGTVATDIVPDTDSAYDLGSPSLRFKHLYLSGSTVFLGNLLVKDSGGTFTVQDSNGVTQPIDLGAITTDDVAEGSSNLYFTTARADSDAKNSISVTDAGGDGSLTYSASTGIITYTGPSALEVRAHLVAGNGVSYDSTAGVFSTDSNADVVFNNITTQQDIRILGNLTVEGTTTTVNSTELSVNDKNIVLADSAADSAAANGGGITLNGANASIIYNHLNSSWDFNRGIVADSATINGAGYFTGNVTANAFAGDGQNITSVLTNYTTSDLTEGNNLYYLTSRFDSDFDEALSRKTTDNLNEGSINFYYTKSRTDSDVNQGFADRTTDDLAEGTNLYYTLARDDSAFDVRLATKSTDDLTEGSNLYYTLARDDSAFDVRLADKSTTDLAEGTNLYYLTARSDSDFDIRLATKTTDNLSEGSANLYYTTNRFDSDLTSSTSASTIRSYFSGSGDITYDSNNGVFSIDVEQIYTEDNFDSDFRVRLLTTTTDSIGEGSNLYYTRARFDSALGDATSTATIRGYFSSAGDLSYNSGTGEFSIDVETIYTKANFDSDLGDASTDNLPEGSTNLYFTTARADSDAKNAVSVTDAGGDGSLSYDNTTGIITYTGPSASEVRAHLVAGTSISYDSAGGVISTNQALDSTSDVKFNSVEVTSGEMTSSPTAIQATSDVTVIVDTTAHNSAFTSIEYTVHMENGTNSQISKMLLTYDTNNVAYSEYAVVDTFASEDSDMGTLDADVSGGDIRLKFARATGTGTVNIKPIKTIIT